MLKRFSALLLSIVCVFSLFTLPVNAEEKSSTEDNKIPFQDISVTSWMCKGISYAWSNGIMKGVSENQFNSSKAITRAEFITLIGRMLSDNETDYTSDTELVFKDVPVDSSSYYRNYVYWAVKNNIITGNASGLFMPNSNITRQDMALIIYRAEKLEGITDIKQINEPVSYNDESAISPYALDAVKALQIQGILTGDTKNCVNPKSKLTRAEAATIIMRFDSAVKNHEHDYVKQYDVEAACEIEGHEFYLCSCGSYYGNKTADALKHNYVKQKEHTEDNRILYICSNCNDSYTTPVADIRQIYTGDSVLSFKQMNEYIAKFVKMYPELITTYYAGNSVWGNSIPVVEFGKGSKYIMIAAGLHPREQITTNYIMEVLDTYSYLYYTNGTVNGYHVKNLLDEYTLVIMPCVNPDGRYLAQTDIPSYYFNANGVQLNTNFPTNWKLDETSGPYAGSEPETQAVLKIMTKYPYKCVLDLHCYGEVIYYADVDCSQAFQDRSYALAGAIASQCNYRRQLYDSTPGLPNYARHPLGIPGLTIEMWTPTDWPMDVSQFYPKVWNKLSAMPAITMAWLDNNP